MGYLINNDKEIVEAKVIVTEAEILAGNIVKDIPEFPAIRSKAWRVLYLNCQFSGTAYTGLFTIHIQASGAPNFQARAAASLLTLTPFFLIGVISQQGSASSAVQFAVNDKLQLHSSGVATGGTGDLTCYIGANLFTI